MTGKWTMLFALVFMIVAGITMIVLSEFVIGTKDEIALLLVGFPMLLGSSLYLCMWHSVFYPSKPPNDK